MTSSNLFEVAPDGSTIDQKIVPPAAIKRELSQSSLSKQLSRVRARVDRFMSGVFERRYPGKLLCLAISLARPLVVLLTPNDKWSLIAHLPYWMKALRIPPLQPLPRRKRIFMHCAYRGQFTMDFMIATLLAWRGHEITIGYQPKLQSPIKQPLEDHATAKPYLANVLGRVLKLSGGRIRCIDLTDEPLIECVLDEDFIRSQVKSDVVMYSHRETLELDIPEVQQAWNYYEKQARGAQKSAWSYLSRNRDAYDLCLIANGTTFEGAQFCRVAKAIGMPINTYEKFAFSRVRILNHGDDFRNLNDLNAVWQQREKLGYTAEPFFSRATDRAYELLNERRTASKATWTWTLQSNPTQNTEDALKAAGLQKESNFILVCPNVPFDAGYDGLLGLFSSMREWLYETVRHLLENTSSHVVVRAHPAEAALWGAKERSEETLASFLNHPRLTLITHDRPINTYGLMETCKFGVVFSSTTGLEMAMMGKLVVVGANIYYARKGFTFDSDNRTEYNETLTRFAKMPDVPKLTDEQKQEARLFHFLLHFVMQWPFPYDKPVDLPPLPFHKLLRSPDILRYIPFLDALCLSDREWQEQLPHFLSADGTNHIPFANSPGTGRASQAA